MKAIARAGKRNPRIERNAQERVDCYALARLFARDKLKEYPETLKTVEGYIRSRDVKSLATLASYPDRALHDSEFSEIFALRQLQTLFSKNSAFSDDVVCSEAAKKSFLAAEVRCRIANKRLDWYGLNRHRLDAELNSDLRSAEREIARLLGSLDSLDFSELLTPRLTSGATEDRSRKRSFPYLKVTGKLRAPLTSVPYIGRYLQEIGVDLSSCRFTAVENNTVVFVPKSWKTHRTIAKEPTHSLPFQLALDSFLKQKLRKWGIDLSSQEKNQELAREGSIDGSLATLDLESASDTLAYNAVCWLLPHEWFRLFEAFRSSSYSAPWGRARYAKFSSMGNGYTFTLETLIFAALARAVGSQRYSVYGDDIIIETALVPRLHRLLTFLGFRLNKDKSFVNADSRFRESCGCDYYKGVLVTPFYLRELPLLEDRPGVCHAVNGLLSRTHPGLLWDYLLKLVRGLNLRLVPYNEDSRSGVFISPWYAWRSGRLRTPGPSRDRSKPWYSSPEFRGYVVRQALKEEGTKGSGSYLLWHLRARTGKAQPSISPKRTSQLLLSLNAGRDGSLCSENITSEVVIRSRYVHGTKRYVPVQQGSPSYLFLWDEIVDENRSPRKPA